MEYCSVYLADFMTVLDDKSNVEPQDFVLRR